METTAEPVQTAPETQQTGAETATTIAAPAVHTPSEAQPEPTAAERHKQVREKLSASIRDQVAADAKPKDEAPTAPKADNPNPQPTQNDDGQPKPGEKPAEGEQEPKGEGSEDEPGNDKLPERMRLGYLKDLGDELGVETHKIMARDRSLTLATAMQMARVKLGIAEPAAPAKPDAANEPAKPDDGKPKEPRTSAEIEARLKELEAQDVDIFNTADQIAHAKEVAKLTTRYELALAREADEQARAEASAQQERDRLASESLSQLIADYPELWDAKAGDWKADSPLLQAAQDELDALVKADPSKATDPLAQELCFERAARKLGIAPQRGKAPAKPATSATPPQPEAPRTPAAPPRTAPPLGGATNGTPTPNNGGFHTREDIAASKLPPAEKHRLTRQLIASSLRDAA